MRVIDETIFGSKSVRVGNPMKIWFLAMEHGFATWYMRMFKKKKNDVEIHHR